MAYPPHPPRRLLRNRSHPSNISRLRQEQRQEILRIVGKGWSTRFAQSFSAWMEFFHKNFNYEFPIHQLGEKAANFLQRHNLSPFVHSSSNSVVFLCETGLLPDALLLVPSERLANLIEEADLSDQNIPDSRSTNPA